MKIINDLDIEGKLKIVQDTKSNSFTFDSVLLANFTTIKKKDKNIVDLCSGNAPVAMLLTLKKKDLKIKCVELQKEIAQMAVESIKINNLENQIEVINDDLKNISNKINKNYYDIITCNPPYFRVDEHSNINENDSVAIARHEIKVNLEDIIIESKKLLTNVGTLNLVHRPDRLDEIIILLNKYGFTINKLQFVYPAINKSSNTVLIEAKKTKTINNKMQVLEPVFVYDENQNYTEQAQKIMDLKGS